MAKKWLHSGLRGVGVSEQDAVTVWETTLLSHCPDADASDDTATCVARDSQRLGKDGKTLAELASEKKSYADRPVSFVTGEPPLSLRRTQSDALEHAVSSAKNTLPMESKGLLPWSSALSMAMKLKDAASSQELEDSHKEVKEQITSGSRKHEGCGG